MAYANNQLLIDASAGSNQTSNYLDVASFFYYAVHGYLQPTDTAVGTISLQGSCDPAPEDNNFTAFPTNWVNIANSSGPISAGQPYLINVQGCGYSWIRVIYTVTSGTGTINIQANLKGVLD